MKLTVEQIHSIARGAVRIEEQDGKICLFRFTKEQEELYKATNTDFYNKSFATAGIVFEFITNSRHLAMTTEVASGSSRKFFEHSIFVNGKKYAGLDCRGDNCGIFSGSWTLPNGDKTIKIYFPWSTASRLHSFELDDGASLVPVKKERTMIMFGDSITHGYDARHPENSYASRLSDALDTYTVNKGIGGERFFPALAALKDPIDPDYITVAYGTNDWSKGDKEAFETKCEGFYKALSENYPNAKIFAITPIWRKAYPDTVNAIGTLDDVAAHIEKVTADLPNVTVINGIDLVPWDAKYFAPDVLHPNDRGFKHYFENLVAEIKKYI